jgi:hypothetical protein
VPHQVIKFGRRFPDKRAKQLIAQAPSIRRFLPKARIKLPANFDLRNVNGKDYTAPIADQGNEGSCTGFGAYAMKGGQERIAGSFQEDISQRMIYNDARKRGGLLGQEGAYMIDVMQALLEDGVCRSHYWPYVAQGSDKDEWPPPNPDALMDAENWKIKDFADCMKDEDGSPAKDPVYNVQAAIYFEGKPVEVRGPCDSGTPWTKSWVDNWYTGNMPVPPDNDPLEGGHSWDIIGWKTDSKGKVTFIGQNSWGKTNLMGGYFEVPAETLTCRNWQSNGGCEIYRTIDAESHICPDGQHWDEDQGKCVDDSGGPEPTNCEDQYMNNIQVCQELGMGNIWNWIICVVNAVITYYLCKFGLQYKVSTKKSLTSKKKKTLTVTVTEV